MAQKTKPKKRREKTEYTVRAGSEFRSVHRITCRKLRHGAFEQELIADGVLIEFGSQIVRIEPEIEARK